MDRASANAFAAQGAAVYKALWGETVTIGGTNYTAAIGLPPFEGRLAEGGETFSGDLLISILKTDLATAPAAQTEVTARGKVWVVTRDPDASPILPSWTLRCQPRN